MAGKPMLAWILDRVHDVKNADKTIVATTKLSEDDAIVKTCKERGTICFRGSVENVLSRYIQAARLFNLHHVVRLTGDNPFPDAVEIDFLIQEHLRSSSEYSSNIDALPVGIGAEVFRYGALFKIESLTNNPTDLEHVNEYILNHQNQFRINKVSVYQPEWSNTDYSFTVDTINEFNFAEALNKEMVKNNVTRVVDVIGIAAGIHSTYKM
jgi:spore coat polysaccharide biosynthesis protein SpsF